MKPVGFCGVFVTAAVVLLAVAFLPGCSGIVRDFPETRLFIIETPHISGTGAGFDNGKGLLIRQLDIAAEFESSFFVYKVSDNRFTSDYYNKFMVSPARMISDAVQDALGNTRFFRRVPVNEPSRIDFRLSGKITRLYADLQNPENPQAVMALRLVLEKQTTGGFMPVINQEYTASEPTSGKQAHEIAQAWNRCLVQVVRQFLSDVDLLI
jgi:ABC-type uncharacterized transport system auxiliary subunit